MHPRKMYNPNRGKKHAARLRDPRKGHAAGQVRYSRRDPRPRTEAVSYAAT